MYMNRNLVNRALLAAGQSPLKDADFESGNSNYDMAREFYLATWLEALSEIPWTGGRKRARLVLTRLPVLRAGFRFAYDLPLDCARALELRGNAPYLVEGRLLYAGQERAELLYVGNGRTLPPVPYVRCGGADTAGMDMEYIFCGGAFDRPEEVVRSGGSGAAPAPEPGGDFPGFRLPDGDPHEPKFWQYLEKTLAAKFAMKLSDRPELRAQLLQEAMILGQEAAEASLGSGASQQSPQRWWTDELEIERW